MARNWLNSKLPKPKYEFNLRTGILKKNVKRKPFKTSTKKIEWNKSAGRADDDFKMTSKCRLYSKCGNRFVWGGRGYQFDHWDNVASNNRQSNCRLLCANCHSKHTKQGSRKIKGAFGQTIGHKKILHKVGYKKVKKAKKKKTRKASKPKTFDFNKEMAKRLKGLN